MRAFRRRSIAAPSFALLPDAAENKGAPPPELTLAWSCKQWQTLPEPGGRRDQRAGELERMSAAINTYDAIRAFRASKNWAEFAKRNPGAMAAIARVRELRRGS